MHIHTGYAILSSGIPQNTYTSLILSLVFLYTQETLGECVYKENMISHMKIYEMALLASDLPYFFGMG